MRTIADNSDKSFKWSDYEGSNQYLPSTEAQTPSSAAIRPRRLFSPRLPHRNLQALRKAHLQMPKGPGTWTKVLPLRQLSRSETGDDLHPQRHEGQSAVLCRQSSRDESDPGRDQRNKSGTYSSAGYVLNDGATRHRDRYQRCRGYRRQHGFGFLSCRAIQGDHRK